MGTTIKNGIATTRLNPNAGGGGSVEVIDNLESSAADKALSANQGRVLNERVNNLEGIGRFLSLWNAETGLAESTPPELPYIYDNGCYFRIGTLPTSGSILMPNGSQYTGEASTTAYSGSLTLEVGDLFVYDAGSNTWLAQKNQIGGKVQDVQVNNTSILVNGVAKIPIASGDTLGVAKIGGSGLNMNPTTGKVSIESASNSTIENKNSNYQPIVPSNLDKAIKEGLGNYNLGTDNVNAWSDAYKEHARQVLGISSEQWTATLTDGTTVTKKVLVV